MDIHFGVRIFHGVGGLFFPLPHYRNSLAPLRDALGKPVDYTFYPIDCAGSMLFLDEKTIPSLPWHALEPFGNDHDGDGQSVGHVHEKSGLRGGERHGREGY